MKTMVCLLVTIGMLPTATLANDRTEEGTSASRHVAEVGNGEVGITDTTLTGTQSFGAAYVSPAGTDPLDTMVRRFGLAASDPVEFSILKREGIERDSGNDD